MDIFKYYQDLQFRASQDANRCTCHFLKIENDNPHPHGSGVFIKFENLHFLFTAAHVVDNIHNEIYVGIEKKKLLKLGGKWKGNIAESERENDRIDLAILELDEITVEKLKPVYEFLEFNEVGINHKEKLLPQYQFVGFPATMSKFNKFKNQIKSVPYIYNTIPAKLKTYKKLKCSKAQNIIVQYDKKKTKDNSTGVTKVGPDLYGISGCGLWFTPIQMKKEDERVDKKLIGIMTEWPIENKKVLIATRIDLFSETLRNEYNLNIPESRLLKVND